MEQDRLGLIIDVQTTYHYYGKEYKDKDIYFSVQTKHFINIGWEMVKSASVFDGGYIFSDQPYKFLWHKMSRAPGILGRINLVS